MPRMTIKEAALVLANNTDIEGVYYISVESAQEIADALTVATGEQYTTRTQGNKHWVVKGK